MENAISINGITKSFGEKKVLDDINLDVKKGEILGLLGPSGAGKTTLIKILTGQLSAENGKSVINGINSQKLSGDDYRNFGIMMDNFGVYDRLSCFENLKIFARIYGIKNDKINEALESVGLSDAKKTPAQNLSKGMKSRLRLARVFMINPDILFLDEPTSGLDPATADEIQKMIQKEKEKGKTIFLTTHTMTEAEKLCDNVALLSDGKIVEYGNPKEICRRYNHQKKLKIHLTDGTEKEIPHDENSAEIISELIKSGRAETIHTTEPDLETVFMELTGKELTA
ncbi:MAG: ABC transporter ATP-binding protein [Oscillospiraceae bacterium]|nr:ABC transporter ATP-binding protein [Oscillospiraceae bacterium]MBQ5314525.1 ABC transporter ATP-binding protein [Oscillospiraceae bacterium]MBQ7958614.1 ABC transporter ATP-binding protein [Oscillospiraceae bacterium]MBR4093753.1 ABC transporter ATP-binding protein [Oscillospiraceae bacterium]